MGLQGEQVSSDLYIFEQKKQYAYLIFPELSKFL